MSLQPNQNVEIQVLDGSNPVYRSRTEDVFEDTVLIAAPLERGDVVPLRVGTKLKISFIADSGKNQGRNAATAVVKERHRGHVPQLLLEITGPWERIQERSFVRVDVFIPVKYSITVNGQPSPLLEGTVTNISGGGVRLVTPGKVEMGTRVWISMDLEDTLIEVIGDVCRIEENAEGQYSYGIAFSDLEERARQTVIQYVFRKQLDLRRKGLLSDKRRG